MAQSPFGIQAAPINGEIRGRPSGPLTPADLLDQIRRDIPMSATPPPSDEPPPQMPESKPEVPFAYGGIASPPRQSAQQAQIDAKRFMVWLSGRIGAQAINQLVEEYRQASVFS